MWIKIILKESYNTNLYLTSVHYFMLFSQICESFYYLETNEKEINLGSWRESWMLCLYKNSNCMHLTEIPKCNHCQSMLSLNLYLQLRLEKHIHPTPSWKFCIQNGDKKVILKNKEVLIQALSRSSNWSKSNNSQHPQQNVLLLPVPTATTY